MLTATLNHKIKTGSGSFFSFPRARAVVVDSRAILAFAVAEHTATALLQEAIKPLLITHLSAEKKRLISLLASSPSPEEARLLGSQEAERLRVFGAELNAFFIASGAVNPAPDYNRLLSLRDALRAVTALKRRACSLSPSPPPKLSYYDLKLLLREKKRTAAARAVLQRYLCEIYAHRRTAAARLDIRVYSQFLRGAPEVLPSRHKLTAALLKRFLVLFDAKTASLHHITLNETYAARERFKRSLLAAAQSTFKRLP